MNKELFDKLDRISDKIFDIDVKTKRINEMLEELIAALHNYDDGLEMFEDEPKQTLPCVGHDAASWEQEAELNKRMDVIGQNGNEGLHYDAEDDYGTFKRKDNVGEDNNNNPAKHTVGEKKRNKRKYYKPKPKSAIVEHQKYPPHKH